MIRKMKYLIEKKSTFVQMQNIIKNKSKNQISVKKLNKKTRLSFSLQGGKKETPWEVPPYSTQTFSTWWSNRMILKNDPWSRNIFLVFVLEGFVLLIWVYLTETIFQYILQFSWSWKFLIIFDKTLRENFQWKQPPYVFCKKGAPKYFSKFTKRQIYSNRKNSSYSIFSNILDSWVSHSDQKRKIKDNKNLIFFMLFSPYLLVKGKYKKKSKTLDIW